MNWTVQLLLGALTDLILTAGAFLMGGNVATGSGVLAMPSRAMLFYALVAGLVGAAKHVNGMMVDASGPSSMKPALLKAVALVVALPLLAGCALTTGYAGKHPGFQDITCKGKVAITGSGTVALGAGYGGATTDSFSLNGDCGEGFSITRSQGKAVPVAVPIEPAPTTTK